MVTIRTIDQAKQLLSDSELDSDEWLQLQQFVNQCVLNQQAQQNAWFRETHEFDLSNKLVD